MKTDLFQSCGHCWVFQICWHIEFSTFTASSFTIWNSSIGILSPPLALFVVTLSKAYLTSHSRMSGSRSVITPSWLSEGLMLKLKLQYLGHLLRSANSLEKTLMLGKIESRKRRGWHRMGWLDWHHWLNGHEFEQALRVWDRQGSLACYSPWDHKELDTTEQLI